MRVPREVILDLLPMYMAGEVTPATRIFVEQVLAQDPELAQRVHAEWARELAGGPVPPPPPELEMQSLKKTRHLLGLQKWIFGLAIAFTAIALTVVIPIRDGRPVDAHFMFRDHPLPFGVSAILGLAFWIGHFWLRRRLRSSV
jgi:hypothetical protein